MILQRRPQLLRAIALALILSAAVLVACMPSDPLAQAAIRRHGWDSINATDLPFGWGHPWDKTIKEPDGYGLRVVYYGADPRSQSYVNVSQDLVYYRTVELSQASYQAAVAAAIPASAAHKWVRPPELDFTARADEMTIACLPGRINDIYHRACRVIARYDDVVMTVYANVFEDRWLTMAQFRRLLERVDARVNSIRVQ